MTLLASYLVKVIACSGVLFLYYHLALRNKVFHQWNRFYLLAATFLSIVIPVVEVQISNSGDDVVFLNAVQAPNVYLNTVVVRSQPGFSPENWIVPGYVFVSVVLLSLLLYSIFRLRQIIRANPVQEVENIKFINTAEQGTPFSFFKFIFWNREINLDTQEGQHIFQHELVHVREKHSFDKLFMQLVLVVFWANPFFWLMRRELKAIHEFIADKKAVGSYGAEAFAAMILQAGFGKHYHAVANSFFEKSIKRRLLMITKMEKARISYFSRVAALPVIAFVVMAFGTKLKDSAKEIVADVVTTVKNGEPARDTIPEMYYKGKRIKNTEVKSRKNTVYLFFEDGTRDSLSMQQAAELKILHPPPPPLPKVEIEAAVNVKEWRSFLSKNLAPIISRLRKTTKPGSYTYMVRFIVGLDGSVSYPEALNDPLGIASELEEMMKRSPKWTPGIRNHNEVRSFHTQPIIINIGSEANLEGANNFQLRSDSNVFSGKVQNALVIVDGKEYSGKLDELSLESIHSFLVLKDASAVAKYGEKGRNGVIEIRTNNPDLDEVIVQGRPLSKGDTVPAGAPVFEKMEQPPYVNMQQWRQHLSKQLAPVIKKAANEGMAPGQYKVELKFIVEKDGSISHVQALNDPGYGLADAAVKTLKNGPKWHPGKQNGRVVRAYHVQPVTFVIMDDDPQPTIKNENTTANAPVFEKLEQPPYVNRQLWQQHLSKQMASPIEKAANAGMTPGWFTIKLKFIVEKDGSISHVQALNDNGEYGLAEAAVKALQTGPKWIPGEQNGRVVRAYNTIPVLFVIPDKNPKSSIDRNLPFVSASTFKKANLRQLTDIRDSDELISCVLYMDIGDGSSIEIRNDGKTLSLGAKKLLSEAKTGRVAMVKHILVKRDGQEVIIPAKIYYLV